MNILWPVVEIIRLADRLEPYLLALTAKVARDGSWCALGFSVVEYVNPPRRVIVNPYCRNAKLTKNRGYAGRSAEGLWEFIRNWRSPAAQVRF